MQLNVFLCKTTWRKPRGVVRKKDLLIILPLFCYCGLFWGFGFCVLLFVFSVLFLLLGCVFLADIDSNRILYWSCLSSLLNLQQHKGQMRTQKYQRSTGLQHMRGGYASHRWRRILAGLYLPVRIRRELQQPAGLNRGNLVRLGRLIAIQTRILQQVARQEAKNWDRSLDCVLVHYQHF